MGELFDKFSIKCANSSCKNRFMPKGAKKYCSRKCREQTEYEQRCLREQTEGIRQMHDEMLWMWDEKMPIDMICRKFRRSREYVVPILRDLLRKYDRYEEADMIVD